MNYPDSITDAENKVRSIKRDLVQAVNEAEERVEQLKKEYQKYNRELPRKEIAKLLGVTPEHVSRLKAEGKLESYKMHDVHKYITNKG